MMIILTKKIKSGRLANVKNDMKRLGEPFVRCVEIEGDVLVLDGAHRVVAASLLGHAVKCDILDHGHRIDDIDGLSSRVAPFVCETVGEFGYLCLGLSSSWRMSMGTRGGLYHDIININQCLADAWQKGVQMAPYGGGICPRRTMKPSPWRTISVVFWMRFFALTRLLLENPTSSGREAIWQLSKGKN